MRTVLVVAAHPDDEVLGCGATIARLTSEGEAEAHFLILGEGITSRQAERERGSVAVELESLQADARRAAERVGAASVELLDFPDNRFDTVPLLELVKAVERKIRETRPGTVYTHHRGDLNIDHRRTFDAVLTACRPVGGQTVREILSFEVPSSTEWQAPSAQTAFVPDEYVVVGAEHVAAKIEAMESYRSEARPYPHPRSPEALRILAQWRGVAVGAEHAEAFRLVRRVR